MTETQRRRFQARHDALVAAGARTGRAQPTEQDRHLARLVAILNAGRPRTSRRPEARAGHGTGEVRFAAEHLGAAHGSVTVTTAALVDPPWKIAG